MIFREDRSAHATRTNRGSRLHAVYSEYSFDRLLDVGCGDGSLTVRIGNACGATDICGVDVSQSNIRAARNHGVNGVVLDIDREKIPFESGTFDSVHSGEVFDYIENDTHYFREIHRVLKADGTFVVSLPNLASLHNRLALLAGRMPYSLRPEFDCCYSERGSGSEMTAERTNVMTLGPFRETLERHGFRVDRVVGCGVDTTLSLPGDLFDHICTRFPTLSYRNILVCEKASS
ncbi:class I SAM-dependent methyltransferase [Natronococcus roseus]|uniref:class I SAM-dependent methyltransferase n=1 Tax=Natronococcus roseus TaxID=1052014 RepID=UPI00374D9673